MDLCKKGSWVEIEKVILEPSERASNIPEETKKVPYIMKVHGFLTNDAHIGDIVEIKTLIGRIISGKLVCLNPTYPHNFGEPIKELLITNYNLRNELIEILEKESGAK